MTYSEFDVINKYFKSAIQRDDVALGIGDDCALLDVPQNKQLVSTTDTFISGVHFPVQTSPEDIAHKSITINLSDLAAMGAEPAWLSLAITLPEIDSNWLGAFSKSFHHTLKQFNVQLIGGDITKGALSITIQAMGFVDADQVMLRQNANVGDLIYVSGFLGDAALGLSLLEKKYPQTKDYDYFVSRLNRPVARVQLGQELTRFCHCAIDLSDGLFADLGHIIERSHCGAEVFVQNIPYSPQMRDFLQNDVASLDPLSFMSGDDYELCFVVAESMADQVQGVSDKLSIPLTCIGVINDSMVLTAKNGKDRIRLPNMGFNHFS